MTMGLLTRTPNTATPWATGQQNLDASFQSLVSSAPQQIAPTYQGAAIDSYLSSYLNSIRGLAPKKQPDFAFTAPTWNPISAAQVSPEAEAGRSLAFNLSNMGVFSQLAKMSSQADTANRLQQLQTFDPNLLKERDMASSINQSMMRGEVPEDVQRQMERSGAWSSLMAGSPTGARAVTARDLGTTSQNLMMAGQEGSRGWGALMAQLMPEATSTATVMANQGLDAKTAITTALQNATNKLSADTANSKGYLDAATSTADLSLRSQSAKSGQQLGWANLQADALTRWMDAGTTNVLNKYQADVNSSNVLFGNQNRPWQMQGEWLGMRAGQNASYGFGI
jgi:hypothetical protein